MTRSLCCLLLLACAAPLAAQQAVPNALRARPRNQLTLDAGVVGGSLAYARRVSDHRLIGGGGVGGDFLSYMVLAGRHFAEDSGLAYEPKDGFEDKLLFEMAHLSAFVRHEPSERWQIDTGLRASVFFHFDSSDDDPGGGFFVGGYAGAYYGWRWLKIGPRVLVGRFSEDDRSWGCSWRR
jgi:hypothetical protein